MNLFLRAVGLGKIKNRIQLNRLIRQIVTNPDEQYTLNKNTNALHVEYYKKFGMDFGLVARGTMTDANKVVIEHCRPYCFSPGYLECAYMETEYRKGEYFVLGEDEQTGNEWVFQLQNVLRFLNEDKVLPKPASVNIAGLCASGTVVLPVEKDEYGLRLRAEEDREYRDLVRKARNGDETAHALLTIREEETTSMMRERLLQEDFLTVVEGFMLPNEKSGAAYSILGDIISVLPRKNIVTEETVYQLCLDVTGTKLAVYINAEDLVGMPLNGMRFMGSCCLQGKIGFRDR